MRVFTSLSRRVTWALALNRARLVLSRPLATEDYARRAITRANESIIVASFVVLSAKKRKSQRDIAVSLGGQRAVLGHSDRSPRVHSARSNGASILINC